MEDVGFGRVGGHLCADRRDYKVSGQPYPGEEHIHQGTKAKICFENSIRTSKDGCKWAVAVLVKTEHSE